MMGRPLGVQMQVLTAKRRIDSSFLEIGVMLVNMFQARSVSKIFNKHKPLFLPRILVSCEVCVIMTPIIELRKLRHRKVK